MRLIRFREINLLLIIMIDNNASKQKEKLPSVLVLKMRNAANTFIPDHI